MLIYWFSLLKITLASEAMWRKAVVHKDRILTNFNAKGVNVVFLPESQDQNQVFV